MIRSALLLAAFATAALVACGGNSNKPTPTNVPATPTAAFSVPTSASAASTTASSAGSSGSSNSSAGAGGSRGSLVFTGAVNASVQLTAVSCASAGTISIAVAGTSGGVQYGISVQAQRAGSFTFASGTTPGTVPIVQLNYSGASTQATWAAGLQQQPGSGTITVNADRSGSIDTDLNVTGSTSNAVHVKGSWTCA